MSNSLPVEQKFAPQWRELNARVTSGKVPHALLLSGTANIGKREFARRFGAALLCQSPLDDGYACGQCSACHLVAAGSHGDFIEVSPEEDSRVIRIHQIRALCEELALTSQLGGHRVALIDPADAMHTAAANSLLKTLEEPRAGVVIILVTAKLGSIPITIRSRCQRLRLHSTVDSALTDTSEDDNDYALQWRAALSSQGDYLSTAADWSRLDHDAIFRAIFSWVHRQVRFAFSATEPGQGAATAGNSTFSQETAKMEQQQLLGFYEKLLAAYQFAARPGINRRSLYEQLFLEARSLQIQSGEDVRAL